MVGSHGDFWVVAAGGVDQDRWCAKSFFDCQMGCVEALSFHSIGIEKSSFAAPDFNRLDARLAAFGISAQHSDLSAGSAQTFRNSSAQSTGGPNHNRNFT